MKMDSKAKKICIFSAQFLPHMGGVEQYTYHLSRTLIKRGYQVTVVTSNTTASPSREVLDEILVYRMPCFNLMDGRFPILKMNGTFGKIDKILKKTKYDLVIVNTRFYFHSLYAVRYAKKMGVKSILIDHGTSHLNMHNPVLNFAGEMFEHILTAIEKKYCNDFYAVSKASLDWLKHFSIDGKDALYNAIDLENVFKSQNLFIKDYRKIYNIKENATVIAFTGRLIKEKGIIQLINAVKKIREKNPFVYLLIAGYGNEEIFVKENTDEGIIWLGKLNFDEVIALLKVSDIFCLPSDSEGFSSSILEAAASKCYIVTTYRGGAVELILDESYGLIINDNTEATIQDALEKTIDLGEERNKAVEKTFERLKNNFTWEHTASKIEQLF